MSQQSNELPVATQGVASMHLFARGRLGATPKIRVGKHPPHRTVVTCPMGVRIPDRSVGAATGAYEMFWLRLVGFGEVGTTLASHLKGDMVYVVGEMRFSSFMGRDGVKHDQWECALETVKSYRSALGAGRSPWDDYTKLSDDELARVIRASRDALPEDLARVDEWEKSGRVGPLVPPTP